MANSSTPHSEFYTPHSLNLVYSGAGVWLYPPRKNSDTSIGDSINWEWILHCAQNSRGTLHIVSRDSDYGVVFDSSAYLNDQLLQEFKDRVSRRRKIYLHTKLSEALKFFEVNVTPEEEQAEKEITEIEVTLPPRKYKRVDSEFMKWLDEALSAKQSNVVTAEPVSEMTVSPTGVS